MAVGHNTSNSNTEIHPQSRTVEANISAYLVTSIHVQTRWHVFVCRISAFPDTEDMVELREGSAVYASKRGLKGRKIGRDVELARKNSPSDKGGLLHNGATPSIKADSRRYEHTMGWIISNECYLLFATVDYSATSL